jgi:hypothetical protein
MPTMSFVDVIESRSSQSAAPWRIPGSSRGRRVRGGLKIRRLLASPVGAGLPGGAGEPANAAIGRVTRGVDAAGAAVGLPRGAVSNRRRRHAVAVRCTVRNVRDDAVTTLGVACVMPPSPMLFRFQAIEPRLAEAPF